MLSGGSSIEEETSWTTSPVIIFNRYPFIPSPSSNDDPEKSLVLRLRRKYIVRFVRHVLSLIRSIQLKRIMFFFFFFFMNAHVSFFIGLLLERDSKKTFFKWSIEFDEILQSDNRFSVVRKAGTLPILKITKQTRARSRQTGVTTSNGGGTTPLKARPMKSANGIPETSAPR